MLTCSSQVDWERAMAWQYDCCLNCGVSVRAAAWEQLLQLLHHSLQSNTAGSVYMLRQHDQHSAALQAMLACDISRTTWHFAAYNVYATQP